MPMDERFRDDIRGAAMAFCLRCAALRKTDQRTVFTCANVNCRLWPFQRALGMGPDGDFDLAPAGEALCDAHPREVRCFRGLLPDLPAGHDWEADARFHGLVPGTSLLTGRPAAPEDIPWRS